MFASRLFSRLSSNNVLNSFSLIVKRRELCCQQMLETRVINSPNIYYRSYSRLIKARIRKGQEMKKDLNKSVILIDSEGKNKGIMSMNMATLLAESEGMELVEIDKGTKGKEGIYRMMTKKEIYERKKKEREINKKNLSNVIKEIKISTTISDRDLAIKMKTVQKLFEKKYTVKIWVLPKLKRYEMEIEELRINELKKQQQMLQCISEKLTDVAEMITNQQKTGKNLVAIFKPKTD